MDFLLNDRQNKWLHIARELAEQEIKPYVSHRDFSLVPDFDWHLVRVLGKHNLICPTIPEEYGGLGLDMFTTVLILEEIATACPGLAAVMSANMHAVQPILLAGSTKQKEALLPRFAGLNGCLASFALTEHTGGSDIASMNTFARRTSRSFEINGKKEYILNASEAEIITLFAMTDRLHPKSSLRCFILSKDNPRITIKNMRNIAALNYSRMAAIHIDNAVIDIAMVLKEEESFSGYLLFNQTFDIGRVLVAATSVGIARAAYELAYQYADIRIQFGKKIKEHQAVAHALVDMATKIEMARLLVWKACWLINKGDDYTITSAMAKLTASVMAQEVTGMAADILAARAFEKGSAMEHLLTAARVLSTIEGTNNIQRNIIASLL